MSVEEIKSRLRKIKALAESGFGGERDAAEALLSRMMTEYGISIDELDDEALQEFTVGKLNKWERVLWNQLVSLAAFGKQKKKEKGLYTSRFTKISSVKCTRGEFVEAAAAFAVLRRDYKRQLDNFLTAFLISNDLMLPFGEADTPPSEDEVKKQMKAWSLSRGIVKTELHAQLEEKR